MGMWRNEAGSCGSPRRLHVETGISTCMFKQTTYYGSRSLKFLEINTDEYNANKERTLML